MGDFGSVGCTKKATTGGQFGILLKMGDHSFDPVWGKNTIGVSAKDQIAGAMFPGGGDGVTNPFAFFVINFEW